MKISSISTSPDTNTLTVVRGYHNTTATTHATDYTSLTTLGASIDDNSTTSVTLSSVDSLSVDDIIRVGSEAMRVTAINTSTKVITVIRGSLSSSAASSHTNGATVSKYDDNGLIYELDEITDGFVISYYAEPDKLSAIDSSTSIDIDNSLQPLLIDYVKGHALLDSSARQTEPNIAELKRRLAERFLGSFREGLRRYGAKKNDKIGGTRAVVPADLK
jgi:hypothetical protein